MKRKYLFGIAFLLFFQIAFSMTLQNITLNSSSSNASISTSEAINTTLIILGNNYIYLEDFQFNESKSFWINTTEEITTSETFDLNFTESNTIVDSSDFINYIRFFDPLLSTFVSNYLFNNIPITGTYTQLFFTFVTPDTYSWLFNRTGYNQETFNFTTSYSSHLNTTFNVTHTTVSMQMFDIDTLAQLTFNVTILNATNSTVFLNQTNFSEIYENLPSGEVEFIVESAGYSTAKFYNEITPFTSISITGYLIPTNNSDVVTFTVLDKTTDEALSGVTIEAQLLINGTYTTISQAETGDSGQTFMFLDITKEYKFIFSKDGYVMATSDSIPGVTSYTIRLQPEGSTFTFIDGISYSFAPSSPVLYDSQNYTFNGFISGTGLTFMNYTLTDQNGTIIYNATSTNPTGTTFTFQINNLNATQYTQLTQTITYIKDGNTNTISKVHRTTALTSTSFLYYLKYQFANSNSEDDQIFRWLVMIISIGGSLLVGRLVGANLLGNSLLVVVVSGFFAFIGWMPPTYFGAIAVASLIIFMGGKIVQ